jgi:hypothetical protein
VAPWQTEQYVKTRDDTPRTFQLNTLDPQAHKVPRVSVLEKKANATLRKSAYPPALIFKRTRSPDCSYESLRANPAELQSQSRLQRECISGALDMPLKSTTAMLSMLSGCQQENTGVAPSAFTKRRRCSSLPIHVETHPVELYAIHVTS